jgi:MFS family permease
MTGMRRPEVVVPRTTAEPGDTARKEADSESRTPSREKPLQHSPTVANRGRLPLCFLNVLSTARASFLLLPIIYLGFISLGLPDGTLGVAWPPMHTTLGIPIGFAGTIMTVTTILAGISGFSSGRIIARFKTGPVVLASCFLTGSALMLVSQARGLPWLLAASVPLGFGAGAVDAGLNGYVARHYSGRHLNWLHACWGIGATCGPLFMAYALGHGFGWRGGFFALATVQLSLAVLFLATLGLWTAVPVRATHGESGEQAGRIPTTSANSRAGWLSVAIFVIYVAVETTAGLWASSILVVSRGVSQETAGLCTAAYFGSITTGRILVGFVVDRFGARRLITLGAALALVGAATFALAANTGIAAAALVLLGLGFAPIYPCLMHEVPRRFAPDAVQTVIGRQSGAAYLGAASLPAAAGWLAQFSLEGIAWAAVAGVVALNVTVRLLNRLT